QTPQKIQTTTETLQPKHHSVKIKKETPIGILLSKKDISKQRIIEKKKSKKELYNIFTKYLDMKELTNYNYSNLDIAIPYSISKKIKDFLLTYYKDESQVIIHDIEPNFGEISLVLGEFDKFNINIYQNNENLREIIKNNFSLYNISDYKIY